MITKPPKPSDPGAFGAIRKYDIHTGIDLYCNDGAKVNALYDGIIVNIEKFTGEHANTPWWNNTWSILVKDTVGTILYGELIPNQNLYIGAEVKHGDVIGVVKQVLKVDKKVTPLSMLHMELYTPNTKHSTWWHLNTPKPSNLLNPEIIFNPLQYMKYVNIKFDEKTITALDVYGRKMDIELLPICNETKSHINNFISKCDISQTTGNSDKIHDDFMEIKKSIQCDLFDWIVK